MLIVLGYVLGVHVITHPVSRHALVMRISHVHTHHRTGH